jgi:hypothetical protein
MPIRSCRKYAIDAERDRLDLGLRRGFTIRMKKAGRRRSNNDRGSATRIARHAIDRTTDPPV